MMYTATNNDIMVSYSDYATFSSSTTKPLHESSHHSTESSHKCVSFIDQPIVCTVLHRSDYQPEELRATWYNRVELRAMKKDARDLANSSEEASRQRGLENKSVAGAQRRRQIRMDARTAVFFEQDMQEDDGYSDPDAIADCYFEYSELSRAEAFIMAQQDEKEASEVYGAMMKEDDMELSLSFVVSESITGSAAA